MTHTVEQFYLDCLSQASYLITDHRTRQAVVVDPRRDIEPYLAAATDRDARIVGVINTHFHADFVSGNQELAAATGGWLALGARARAGFAFRGLADDEVIALGDTALRIWHTPGHTPESICVLVGPAGGQPGGVLTGDTLFIGDVGRPDLVAAADSALTPTRMALDLYAATRRLLTLPDQVRVLPGHGAGSSCGKNLSTQTSSTIGAQRMTNPMLADLSAEEFVAAVIAGQPSVPRYFPVNAGMNQRPLQPSSVGATGELSAEQVAEHRRRGGTLVDVRDPDAFATGHLAGSVNIGLAGRLAETAGMLLDYATDLVLVADDVATVAEARTRLQRVGLDRIVGHVVLSRWSGDLALAQRLDPTDVRRAPGLLLDVRNPGEIDDAGTLPRALNVPLPELVDWVAQPANRQRLAGGVTVLCAGGWRSSVAASFLRTHTGAQVTDVRGGWAAVAELLTGQGSA